MSTRWCACKPSAGTRVVVVVVGGRVVVEVVAIVVVVADVEVVVRTGAVVATVGGPGTAVGVAGFCPIPEVQAAVRVTIITAAGRI